MAISERLQEQFLIKTHLHPDTLLQAVLDFLYPPTKEGYSIFGSAILNLYGDNGSIGTLTVNSDEFKITRKRVGRKRTYCG